MNTNKLPKGIRLRGGATVEYYKPTLIEWALPSKRTKRSGKVSDMRTIKGKGGFDTFSLVVDYPSK